MNDYTQNKGKQLADKLAYEIEYEEEVKNQWLTLAWLEEEVK